MKRVGKVSKYRNVKTRIGDKVFDSKKEAGRYILLRDREKAGEITDLKTQVKFPIVINGIKVCVYVADFAYDEEGGRYTTMKRHIVEDAKSEPTRKNRAYRIKCKLMKAVHGITITEV